MASGTIDDPEILEVLSVLSPPGDGVKRFQTTGDPVAGTRWFVLSMSWFLKWKRSKGLEPGDGESPGPIDNGDVVLDPNSFYTSLVEGDYRNVIVRPGLTLNLDYLLISLKAWTLLSKLYSVRGPTIQRYSIALGEASSTIEVLLKPVLVTIIPKRDKEITALSQPKPIYVSKRDDQNRLKERLIDVYNKKMSAGASKASLIYSALWKVDPNIDLGAMAQELAAASEPLDCPGELIPKDTPIDACDIASDDIVLLELWDKAMMGRFRMPRPAKTIRCGYCNKELTMDYKYCVCAQICYCGEACLRKDRQFHDCSGTKQKMQAYAKSYQLPGNGGVSVVGSGVVGVQTPRTYGFSERSMRGLTGLQNLGNSCFMNSGLQCILHTEKLVPYFLQDQHLPDLNPTNPIGAKGELATALGILVKEVWMATAPRYAPWEFKRTLGRHLRQFDGYNQHDAHEFLIFALDLVHEDVNRVRVKPLPRELPTENIPEPALKSSFWSRHKERNDSVIVDLMHGLLRSESQCPTCQLQSLSFDPFLTLSITLPMARTLLFDVVFVPLDCAAVPIRMKIRLQPYSTLADVKIAVSQLTSRPISSLYGTIMKGESVFKLPVDTHVLMQEDRVGVFEGYPEQFPLFLNLFSKPTEDASKPCCLSRLLPIHLPATNREMYESAYLALSALTRREQDSNFPRDFPQFHGFPGQNLFYLRVLNLPMGEECLFCHLRGCRGCPVGYTTDRSVEAYCAILVPGTPLIVEVVVGGKEGDCLKMIKEPMTDRSWDQREQRGEEGLSLYDCLDATFSREQLDPSNSIYCCRCNTHVAAFRKLSLAQTAEVLIIQLKRFRHTQGLREKDERKVEFPIKGLDLTQYLHEHDPGSPPVLYDLYSVSYHYGDMGFGHYTAGCRLSNEEWWHFNDSVVSLMKPEDLVSAGAYILFYQLRQG